LKEVSLIELKKVVESTDETNRRKNSNIALSKVQIIELKKANLVTLNMAKHFKSGFNKRLLSKLGCHLIIKLINTEKFMTWLVKSKKKSKIN
jgi:hypothetical protein